MGGSSAYAAALCGIVARLKCSAVRRTDCDADDSGDDEEQNGENELVPLRLGRDYNHT